MPETYHIIAKKEGAIEDLELPQFELSESQQAAIEQEIVLLAGNTDYLQKGDDVKSCDDLCNLYKPCCVN